MLSFEETQRLKDELDANPENYNEIIEDTDLGICITNESGHFVAINDNYCRIYGYERNELVGQHFDIVLPNNDDKADLVKLHDQFIKFKTELFRNWTVKGKDGNLISIIVDAGYSDKIEGAPHKITFIWPIS